MKKWGLLSAIAILMTAIAVAFSIFNQKKEGEKKYIILE